MSAFIPTGNDSEVPDGEDPDGEDVYAEDVRVELAERIKAVASTVPAGESVAGGVELCAFLAGRVGEQGALRKKTIKPQLSKEAKSVGWKEENSRDPVIIIDPNYYTGADGNPRRGKTEVWVGWDAIRLAEICDELGVDTRALVEIAKALNSKQGPALTRASTTASTTAKAQVNLGLRARAMRKGGHLRSTSLIILETQGKPSRHRQQNPTGIEYPLFQNTSSEAPDSQKLSRRIDAVLYDTQMANPVSNEVDTAPEVPVIVQKALQRQTCERSTIQAIYDHVPAARTNKVIFRWIVYALWTNWRDKVTFNRIVHHRIMDRIGCYRYKSARAVFDYIREYLPIEVSEKWSEGEFTRQILEDGLPEELWKQVQIDLDTSPADYDTRVYVLTGNVVTRKDPARIRKELREEVARMESPSETSRRIREAMNDLPPNRFSRFQDQIGKALEYVKRMEIDVSLSPLERKKMRDYTGCEKDDDTGELSGNVERCRARVRLEKREKAEEQRTEYKKILHNIAHQHKPFYKPSRQEHTDRIFHHNDSALGLPSEVRDILCDGLYDVDLKSAHLFIAAWLWGAEEALETLTQDGYSIWDDLMEYCWPLFEKQGLEVPEKGTCLYDEVKAVMKIMVYSTVYGMPASSIQAEVTKSLKHILGPDVGARLREHHVIQDLLQKRDEILEGLEPGDTLRAPSGIEIEVEVGLENEGEEGYEDLVGPKSAVATQAQAYEQELMSVLLDVAEERSRFRILLWLHDGTACDARYPNAVEDAVNEALEDKRRELTEFAGKDTLLPAVFEVEEIEAPELPPKDVHERIASAGGGVVRLKDGETAVKVDPDTGEELGPVDSSTLLRREHAFYKVASTYIRITGDGYSIESDPFPEERLWQSPNDSSQSSTSPTEESQTDQSQNRSEGETVPGAENLSEKEEAPSLASDTSTTSAQPAFSGDSIPAETEPPEPSESRGWDETGASESDAETSAQQPVEEGLPQMVQDHLQRQHEEKRRRQQGIGEKALQQEHERIAKWRQENPVPDLTQKEVEEMRGKSREEAIAEESHRIAGWRAKNPEPDLSPQRSP